MEGAATAASATETNTRLERRMIRTMVHTGTGSTRVSQPVHISSGQLKAFLDSRRSTSQVSGELIQQLRLDRKRKVCVCGYLAM